MDGNVAVGQNTDVCVRCAVHVRLCYFHLSLSCKHLCGKGTGSKVSQGQRKMGGGKFQRITQLFAARSGELKHKFVGTVLRHKLSVDHHLLSEHWKQFHCYCNFIVLILSILLLLFDTCLSFYLFNPSISL